MEQSELPTPQVELSDFLAQARQELKTLADFVRLGATVFSRSDVFFGHGTDNAVDEATQLVLHALSLEPGLASELWHGRLLSDERAAITALFERRIVERKPAAYLTGRAWYGGLEFVVNESVLVPRSPIAELIGQGFEPWWRWSDPERILDLCTGSGCLAVLCAEAFPFAKVEGSDISEAALDVARLNVERFGLQSRVDLINSDLFAQIEGPFDLIVSNPPYVPIGEMSMLPIEFGHEPEAALVAGEDGLDCIHRILAGAAQRLSSAGLLVLEVGAARPAFEVTYAEMEMAWPEFEHGGAHVALIEAQALHEYFGA